MTAGEILWSLFCFVAGGGISAWAMAAMAVGAQADRDNEAVLRTIEERARRGQ